MRIYMVAIPNLMNIEGGVVFLLLALIFPHFPGKSELWPYCCILPLVCGMLFQSAQHGFSDIQWMMILRCHYWRCITVTRTQDKWFFYIFYPSHLAVLYIISTVFLG